MYRKSEKALFPLFSPGTAPKATRCGFCFAIGGLLVVMFSITDGAEVLIAIILINHIVH